MLLMRSFWNLEHQRLGMRSDNTLTVSITVGRHNYPTGEKEMALFQRLQQRLQFGPGVSMVAMSDSLPPGANHNGQRYDQIVVEGRPPSPGATGSMATFRWVSPDYFRALDIPIVRGEDLTTRRSMKAIAFTYLARRWLNGSFRGRILLASDCSLRGGTPAGPWWTVVGVAADVPNGGANGVTSCRESASCRPLRRDRAGVSGGSGEWGRTAVMVGARGRRRRWWRCGFARRLPTLDLDFAGRYRNAAGRVGAGRRICRGFRRRLWDFSLRLAWCWRSSGFME